MEKTFAYRRREVIEDMPFIAEFKNRWPALFSESQLNAEFTRITTIPLLSTFMAQLDHYSSQLMKVFKKKGGAAGRSINQIMAAMDQDVDFAGLEKVVLGIYIVEQEGAEATDAPEDVCIIIEGCTVLQDLRDVANGCAALFGLIYSLNLSYPKDLRYTFEFFQRVLMGLDGNKLSTKVQVLKNKCFCIVD